MTDSRKTRSLGADARRPHAAPRQRQTAIERTLDELRSRLAAIVEDSHDAITSKDLNGDITTWNAAAESMYLYTADEIIGQSVALLVPPELADEIPRILEKVRRGERIEHYDTMRRRKDGTLVPVSLSVSPIRGSGGEVVGASTIARDITRRKQQEEALRQSEARLALALEAASDGVWDWRVDTGEAYLSPKYYEMSGYSPGSVTPNLEFFESLIHRDDRERVLKTMQEHLAGRTEESVVEYRMITAAGLSVQILGKGKVIERDAAGRPTRMIGTISDISSVKRAQEQVQQAKEEWERTFDAIPDLVVVIDEQRVIRRANRALASRLGADRNALVGMPCYQTVCKLGEPTTECPGARCVVTGTEHAEERYVAGLGGHYLVTCSPIPAVGSGGPRFVEVCRDISERREMEERLREAAIRDPLTGLFNRRGFLDLASQHLTLAERSGRNVVLLFLDLNDMKKINDELGHAAGDRALVDTASILRKTFRRSDIIARMGGDEFAVMLTEPSATGIERIVAEHLRQTIETHNAPGDSPYRISFSFGMAISEPERRCSLDDLLAIADQRMYREKARRKGRRH